ncbi:kinase-like protein [Infundibulicybe gibba]|nr:kinase-like protein [Infundibulicybe gibba]
MSIGTKPRYCYPRLDDIEDLEKYCPGGYHPVSIGDVFSNGRYKVLHKLGFGGSSTVWLAREHRSENNSGKLVTLKILTAEQSSKPTAEIADVYVPTKLQTIDRPGKRNLQIFQDRFIQRGPNGSHLCLVFPLAGPSILSMAECPGRVSGSRRLRGSLARKLARQAASGVELVHSAGIVHGDLTSSNFLLQMSDKALQWSDDDVYQELGDPEMEEVVRRDKSIPDSYAPSNVVAPIEMSRLASPSFLKEDLLLIDFGQSFVVDQMKAQHEPATPLHYLSPEAFFDMKLSFASDVWALACTIFEIRAGCPLFDSLFGSEALVLKQVVETLGRFPEPWWSRWDDRHTWFDETGEPKSEEEQMKQGVLLTSSKSSISQKLNEIGEQDDPPDTDDGNMIEKTGTRLEAEEIELLADLLGKMLRYRPQDRINMAEVLRHPWFEYDSSC